MAKSLIIVESPAKTKTLKNFLGSDFQIEASMGHVRDLPERRLAVNIDQNFEPTYEPLPDRADVLKRLAAAAKGASIVYLASDPDREGEAIAWHLAEALHLKNPRRIQFNEITKQAVQQALQNPRTLDMDRVNAQQARRILDRLIGYKLSPILSRKIQKGLSAGRVQSVAVRLICDREREILAFVPVEYWSLTATLTPRKPEKRHLFPAKLHSRGGTRLEPKSEDEINVILQDLEGAEYDVAEVKKREQKRNAAAPFITSTLQQEASRKLGFSNRRTMQVAQSLYEGVELGEQGSVGLITYMRTDSVRVAAEAQQETLEFIREKYDSTRAERNIQGYSYAPDVPKQFKTKGAAQDAHEAIRPTSVYREPDTIARSLSAEQLKLYRLIWQRFVASQMNPAVLDLTTADIAANLTPQSIANQERRNTEVSAIENRKSKIENPNAPYIFRATGSVIKFDGFMRVYTEGKDTEEITDEEQPPLPPLTKAQLLDLLKMEPRQHFTEPPPRYTEATIVKALEEQGIGRPSTYAAIISTIRDREYVALTEKRFYPTELGFKVTDQLVKHFPTVMDVKFTADMETKLDEVEEGQAEWVSLVRNFYSPFEEALKAAAVEMESLKPPPIETEYRCSVTDNVMLLREGRFGPFMGCSGYPKCKKLLKLDEEGKPIEGANFTCGLEAPSEKEAIDPATLPNATEHVCPQGRGVMLLRQSRFGPFLGCSNYPKCRTSLKINTDGLLKEGQDFACTFSETAGTKRGSKTGAAKATGTARAAKSAAANGKAAKPTTRKTTAAKSAAAKTTAASRAKPKAE